MTVQSSLPYGDDGTVFTPLWRWRVDAAREDGSLGRLVNDDHIIPISKMKIITVEGKPHLSLFATRGINPGEEITYNYGESEWHWRSKTAAEKHQLPAQELSATTSSEAVSEADSFKPTTAVSLETIKQGEQNVAGTVPEVTTGLTIITDMSESKVPAEGSEKITVVKEQSGSDGQDTIGPSKKTVKVSYEIFWNG
ncbi:inactive histone-lysine N-methyltransferase 2E-like [Tachysurus ichikawai]